jgi:hypothetical protein
MAGRNPDVNQENRHAERPAAQQPRKEETQAAQARRARKTRIAPALEEMTLQ